MTNRTRGGIYSLSNLFGKSPRLKIMETLAENVGEDISVPYIADITGVAKSTIYAHIYNLVGEGIVKETRKMGKTQFYQLNDEEERAKMVIMLESLTVSNHLAKVIRKTGEKTFFDEIEESRIPIVPREREILEELRFAPTTELLSLVFEEQFRKKPIGVQPSLSPTTGDQMTSEEFHLGWSS